jgi:hypothetical protein
MKLKGKNIDEVVELLYNKMYTNWYSGNDKVFCGGFKIIDSKRISREIIREYLSKGYDVRTGYYCTKIRGCRRYKIFIKLK